MPNIRDWIRWKKKATAFAKGRYARVFRKNQTNYPVDFFTQRGNLVKIYEGDAVRGYSMKSTSITEESARRIFYEMKIASLLFPQNTPKVRGFRKIEKKDEGVEFYEIHVDEVPVHKELKDFQRINTKQVKGSISKALRRAKTKFSESKRFIDLLKKDFEKYGFFIDYKFSNFSLANPRRPIHMEPELIKPDVLRKQIGKLNISQSKKRMILSYLERWEKIKESQDK